MIEKKNEQTEKECQPENEQTSKPFANFISYSERTDLSKIEKEAIEAYQDVYERNFQRQDWSFEIPEGWKNKTWCYIINSFCRSSEFQELLTQKETETIEFYIEHLERAIQKSRIEEAFWGVRGVSELSWLKDPAVGKIFTEKAFGSFSLDLETAYKYTNPDNPIIFRLKINDMMEALYIDESEHDILRPQNRTYKIIKISKVLKIMTETARINKEKDKETIVIVIEECRSD